MKTVHALQNDTIDLICWRNYGRSIGVIEAVLAANPGIAKHGPFLPMGTKVNLPELQTQQQKTPSVQLWN